MRPTPSLLRSSFRKMRLTTKDVNKGFYKGNRTGRTGLHTKKGGYIIDWNIVRTYVVPDLEGFKLTPFVTEAMPRKLGDYAGDKKGPMNPERFLTSWKMENGVD